MFPSSIFKKELNIFLRLHAERTPFLIILFFCNAWLDTLAFLIMKLFHQFCIVFGVEVHVPCYGGENTSETLSEELPVGLHRTSETQP